MSAPRFISHLQSALAVGIRAVAVVNRLAERLPGFRFDEKMEGSVTLSAPPPGDASAGVPRAMMFHLHAEVPHLGSYLRDGRLRVNGSVTIAGLVQEAALTGWLWIWPQHRIIRYLFTFSSPTDKIWQFVGQKDVRLRDLCRTITTLPGKLQDARGHEMGRALLRFDWADLPAFVKSIRPVL